MTNRKKVNKAVKRKETQTLGKKHGQDKNSLIKLEHLQRPRRRRHHQLKHP